MAAYVPVETTDADFGILLNLSARIKKYVVTWTKIKNEARFIYGVYRTQRQAFTACREASRRSAFAFPLCFLARGADFFRVVGDNIFTH
jgi:hypothetical protein